MESEATIRALVEREFAASGVRACSIQIRSFPGETIAVVEVDADYEKALGIAQKLDSRIQGGFVTVRKIESKRGKKGAGQSVKDVHDSRVGQLLELLNARSRTSETQPSLRFVKDVDERLNLAVSARHQLIFGRRGVGKTSLLLEAKRILEEKGGLVLWVNMHPLRTLDAGRAFLTIALRLCDLAMGAHQGGRASPASVQLISSARLVAEERLYSHAASTVDPSSLVPLVQQAISRFCVETNIQIFVFLDDVHYMEVQQVPLLLDLLHGITRDNPVWLKVAGIQHQTRWFIPNPPTGLQTGHDATIVNLDVTLEHPERASKFLLDVLRGYVEECGALPLSRVISSAAVERLVLASGGVPRDFLTLCASSIQTARQRANASAVGVQDVNNAAGVAGQTKLQELEDDAAAVAGRSAVLIAALNELRKFLLAEQQITYFRVDFRDKEIHGQQYRVLQALADLRMLHLINASLSDAQQAGQRSEVYLLDLSQYSGSRLKQRLRVLDFERGHMVLKRTRSTEAPKVGDTSLRLVALLRQGPVLPLNRMEIADGGI
ncbi:AAA family ATPase [uncultured Xanthomonas sp.]|uniref:AAA family ATPase n=1 Tax=uncultured Xanthomonas sp. TaxID=152831 RepID=UPI0025FCBF9F|nr:AAA family ATPase [uncultured Xanthomonas sp.]